VRYEKFHSVDYCTNRFQSTTIDICRNAAKLRCLKCFNGNKTVTT